MQGNIRRDIDKTISWISINSILMSRTLEYSRHSHIYIYIYRYICMYGVQVEYLHIGAELSVSIVLFILAYRLYHVTEIGEKFQ